MESPDYANAVTKAYSLLQEVQNLQTKAGQAKRLLQAFQDNNNKYAYSNVTVDLHDNGINTICITVPLELAKDLTEKLLSSIEQEIFSKQKESREILTASLEVFDAPRPEQQIIMDAQPLPPCVEIAAIS